MQTLCQPKLTAMLNLSVTMKASRDQAEYQLMVSSLLIACPDIVVAVSTVSKCGSHITEVHKTLVKIFFHYLLKDFIITTLPPVMLYQIILPMPKL